MASAGGAARIRRRSGPLAVVLASVVIAGGSLLGATTPIAGQVAQGQFLDHDTGAPVEGALVLLLDSAGIRTEGHFTNAEGRFLLRAPGPGSYTLRAERIGYETASSEPFVLTGNQTLLIPLEASQSAIQLEGLRVEGEQRCVVRPEEGLEVSRVWEEARKALAVQEWTEGQGLYRFRLLSYERELEPGTLTILSEQTRSREGTSRSPIRSLPVEDLYENGYVRPDESGGYTFYGPDAGVLLSDQFLDSHCLRLTTEAIRPGAIGIAFEPVRRRTVPDIRGTLWLDRATARLEELEYAYDREPWPQAGHVSGGHVEFEEMPSGAWIVRKWWIRMPELRLVRAGVPGRPDRIILIGIREEGGEATPLPAMEPEATPGRPGATISGSVWDSLHGRPLAKATVFLSGTPYATASDSLGGFLLEGIGEGSYLLAFSHPTADSLGVFPPGIRVTLEPESAREVDMAFPPRNKVMEALCGAVDHEEGDAVVTGTLRSGAQGPAVRGAMVTIEWTAFTNAGTRDLRADIRTVEATTDDHGRFRICGIPPGVLIGARASFGERETVTRKVEVEREGIVVIDFALPPGRVLSPF